MLIKKKARIFIGAGRFSKQSGQSVIEVIVALGIFLIIAVSSAIAVIGSLSTTRLAKEESKAANLASEGMEATESIRNQEWLNLTNGSHGLSYSGGTWVFSGTSDTDASGRFTRVITIEDVYRDSGGEIVTSGGSLDDDTKKVTSAITWNFTPTRTNVVDMTAYITNWQMSRVDLSGTGPGTCDYYCVDNGYILGDCKGSPVVCTAQGWTHESSADVYCTEGEDADTCCCNY